MGKNQMMGMFIWSTLKKYSLVKEKKKSELIS